MHLLYEHSYIYAHFDCTYRSLNHLHALMPHPVDGSCNVHHLLFLDLSQHIVDADERTSTTNTSTIHMQNVIHSYM